MLQELRESVRKAAFEMMKAGLVVGSDGNVSGRDSDTGYIAITPSGVPYDQISAADIPLVNSEGKVVWGDRRPSSETPMHVCIHNHRRDVRAIMHTHSHYATLFAIAQRPIPVATMTIAAHFGGPVPCAPYVRPGSPEMGTANLAALGKNGRAMLLGNHGALIVGPDLDKVLVLAMALEEGAKMIYASWALGEPVPLPDAEAHWLFDLVNGMDVEATAKTKVG